jgi:hypothetical protein
VLKSFGFSTTYINLIKNYIEDIPFSILINGSSSSFFNSTRGLRQGDPLSPFLFILAEEALSRGISMLLAQNKIAPYFVTKSIRGISHSLYADDIIIFTNGNTKSLSHLMNFLLDYQLMLGQKINHTKSKFLSSKHINTHRKNKIASITNFAEGNIPFLYLGCNIFYGKSKPIYFENIIKKIQEKLAGWKARMISKGGRLILIKHVLSSIPIHSMTIFDIPKMVIHKIHSIMENFLWLSNNKHSSKHWVAWSIVTKTKEEGGLGIRSLFDVITALRCKRAYRLLNGRNSWSKLMNDIHGHITQNYRNNKTPNRWKNLKNAWYIIEPYLVKQDDNKWVCTLAKNGILTTHLAWNLCRKKYPTTQWGSYIWQSYIPNKISILLWQILHNKLPTDDNLAKLNISLPSKCICCPIF